MIFEKQFKEICKLCDEVLISDFSNKEIVATSWLHVIREHSEFTNRYKILFQNKKEFFIFFLIKKIFYIFLRIFKNYFIKKNKISYIGNIDKIDILIVSHFLNVNQIGKEDDFYFGNLASEIKKLGKKVVISLINHTDKSTEVVKNKWKIDPKISRIIFGKNINIRYEFKIILGLLKNLLKIHKLNKKNYSFKKKIYNQLKKELFSVDTINNLKIYYQTKELIKKYKPKIIILIHEGHAHERIIFKSAREVDKNIKCIGYQHACIFKNQHSLKRHLQNGYNPDIILTSGEKPNKILENNFVKKNVKIKKLGSHRYLKKKKLKIFQKKIIFALFFQKVYLESVNICLI